MRERVVGLRPLLCRSCIEACLDVWRFTCQWLFHVARRHRSIWLSVLRQPAFQSAAPKCHSPSPCELSVLRRPVLGWSLASQRTTNIPQSWLRHPCPALEVVWSTFANIEAVSSNVPRHRPKPWHHRVLARRPSIRQNVCESNQGGLLMQRPNISSQGKVFVFSTPSPTRPSLTVGSTRTSMLRIAAG
jgi:hypothetical protein